MEIRIRDLLPEDLSASDLAKLLISTQEMILGALEGHAEEPSVRVSLVRISRRSTGLHFATPTPQLVLPAFSSIAQAIKGARVLTLPAPARTGLRNLQEFSHRLGKVLEFHLPEPGKRPRPAAAITPSADLFAYTAELISGETELYGMVERVGGAEPKVVLRVSEKVAVHCAVSQQIAQALGHRLYSWVGVAGAAKWSPFDSSIESFRVERILPYEDTPITNAVATLKTLIGQHWAGVDAIAEISALRRGEEQ